MSAPVGSKLKVLFVLPFSPLPADFGGALRVYHLLKQIALRHRVSVLCYGTPEQATELQRDLGLVEVRMVPFGWKNTRRRLGQLVTTFSTHSYFQQSVMTSAFQQALDAMLAAGKYDVVQTEFSHLGPYRLPSGPGAPFKVLDTHNVEYDNFRRMFESTPLGLKSGVKKLHYGLEFLKMKADELEWCRRQDLVLTTSERDRELFDRDLPDLDKAVVPNGVDSDFFTPAPEGTVEEPYSLAFTGMMAYVPNHDGITWFLDEVLPKIHARVPQVKLYVVGKSPPPFLQARASEHVEVTGTVPDVRPYVWRSSVYVVPLRMGGGTRLKICEALAMKKAIVSTRVGCEGIALEEGTSALLAVEPDAFADAVVRLLEDRALAARLGDAGHQLARARYDWRSIGEGLDALYRRRLGR